MIDNRKILLRGDADELAHWLQKNFLPGEKKFFLAYWSETIAKVNEGKKD